MVLINVKGRLAAPNIFADMSVWKAKVVEYRQKSAHWFEAALTAPDELKNVMIDIGFGWQALAEEADVVAKAVD